MLICHLLISLKINVFKKNSFKYTIRVSKSLDPVQDQCFVGFDLGKGYVQTTKVTSSKEKV